MAASMKSREMPPIQPSAGETAEMKIAAWYSYNEQLTAGQRNKDDTAWQNKAWAIHCILASLQFKETWIPSTVIINKSNIREIAMSGIM